MELESQDLLARKIEELQKIFPEIVVDGEVDTDKLHTLLYPNDEKKSEHYSFSWSGKKECYQIIREKSNATLKLDPDTTVPQGDNVFIEGDNLEVLKLLQNAYHKKIKMIYIDPPYNKDKDFVYKDTWGDTITNYLIQTDQLRDEGYTSTRTSSTGRRHTNWLNMIYPRLWLSRNLLRDDGVIFVSIDDDEVHNLRKVMDEIYGEESFVGQFVWHRRQNPDSRNENNVSVDHEYIICYAKTLSHKFFGKSIDIEKYKNPDNDPRGNWASIDLSGLATKDQRPNLHYDIIDPLTGNIYPPNPKRGWSKSQKVVEQMILEGRILFPSNPNGRPREKKFLADLQQTTTGFSTYLSSKNVGFTTNGTRALSELFDGKIFDFPKPIELIQELIQQVTKEKDIILDFFAGSGTTAHAVMAQNLEDEGNRRYVLVQLPEPTDEKGEAYKAGYKKISDITKARIIKAMEKLGYDNGFKSYILDNSNFQRFKEIKKRPGESIEAIEKMLRMSMFHENILTQNAKKLDVVYEIGLKNGFSLSAESETLQKGTYTVIRLYEEAREFFFTFDHAVGNDIRDHFPRNSKLICYDKALDDSTKLNLRDYFILETL